MVAWPFIGQYAGNSGAGGAAALVRRRLADRLNDCEWSIAGEWTALRPGRVPVKKESSLDALA